MNSEKWLKRQGFIYIGNYKSPRGTGKYVAYKRAVEKVNDKELKEYMLEFIKDFEEKNKISYKKI